MAFGIATLLRIFRQAMRSLLVRILPLPDRMNNCDPSRKGHDSRDDRVEKCMTTHKSFELIQPACEAFDPDWYVENYSNIIGVVLDPWRHYVERGSVDGLAPTRKIWELIELAGQTFDADWYASQNPDVIAAGYEPLWHYLKYGRHEGRHPTRAASRLTILAALGQRAFDADWYACQNPDVIEAGLDPLEHYLAYGCREGRPAQLQGDCFSEVSRPHREPVRWLFVGDTIEWMAHHQHFTGVGRVTSEILFVGLQERGPSLLPCVRGHTRSGLIPLQDWQAIDDLVRIGGRSEVEAVARSASWDHSLLCDGLRRGDHVVFTGVVWTMADARLFRQLVSQGITISVLIHDIIPLTEPWLVPEAHARSFAEWFAVTVQTASVVYVSTHAYRPRQFRPFCRNH
jgi:hypothetical protein